VVSAYGLFQPEGQNDMNKTTTTAKILSNGTVVEILDDGSERPFPATPMQVMTDEQIHAAALADPDAQPTTPEQLQTVRRVSRVKTLRRALGITQEDFATRYHIPLGTLRDWEQGRSEPDQPARAYLKAIAGDPVAVCRALENGAERAHQR
jgi:putative transcriptional regulator